MSELLGKLTNLGYELFGIIVPGVLTILLSVLWWAALGPLPTIWTRGVIPELTRQTARDIMKSMDSLTAATGIGVAVPLIAACYFAGHLLHWIARSGPSNQEAAYSPYRRLAYSLILAVPKPANSFNPKLQRLFDLAQQRFTANTTPLEWREFYPVAKSFLAQRVPNSLVSMYQNKYTLHRSIATAGAALFWLSLVAVVGATLTPVAEALGHSYFWLGILLSVGVLLTWGFSGSYVYHWEMFGNTIVTETYTRLYGPRDEQPGK
jgi:hypothetical protein